MSDTDMESVEMIGERIQRRTFPSYATIDFWEAVSMWRDYQSFGFPDHGGYMDQPALWLDTVKLMIACGKKMGVE